MDGEAWWATVHGVAKSWTGLSDLTFTNFIPVGVLVSYYSYNFISLMINDVKHLFMYLLFICI